MSSIRIDDLVGIISKYKMPCVTIQGESSNINVPLLMRKVMEKVNEDVVDKRDEV